MAKIILHSFFGDTVPCPLCKLLWAAWQVLRSDETHALCFNRCLGPKNWKLKYFNLFLPLPPGLDTQIPDNRHLWLLRLSDNAFRKTFQMYETMSVLHQYQYQLEY